MMVKFSVLKTILPVTLLAWTLGCAPLPQSNSAKSAGPILAIDSDFPDPAVLQAADGSYFAYATQGSVGGTMHNIQVAQSSDLIGWTRLADALPVKPAWASATQDFWAPHVSFHDGRYYLYYSAKPDAALNDPSRGLCLAVATADRPQGPFTDIGRPLLCGDSFINIDPMAYDDPETGKTLLYWGSGFGPIKVQELAADRASFEPGSRPIDLIAIDPTPNPSNYRRLIEGAWVVRRDGWYYLFYSGDNCCGEQAHYAVMVARSRHATGPFETRVDHDSMLPRPVVEADTNWLAPGHNSLVTDSQGGWWTLYHAVDRTRPRTNESDPPNSRRVMLVNQINWHDGWPQIIRSDVP